MNNREVAHNPDGNEKFLSENKKKNIGRLALVLVAGGVSNAAWTASIGLNRLLEKNEIATTIPALAFGITSTGVEYGMTHFATAGDIDSEWTPKSRIGNGMKRIMSKFPLVVSSWRGAAGGTYVDEISGREITRKRRLAHAATYGTFMALWVSEAGSQTIEHVWGAANETFDYAVSNPVLSTALAIGIVGAGAYGLGKPKIPEELPEELN